MMGSGDTTPPRPAVTPIQPHAVDDTGDDIYRGSPQEGSSTNVTSYPRRSSVSSNSSDTSSSLSFFSGGRLGAIANVVEHAISRWAKGNSSDTSSSSSASTVSSVNTATRSRRRRRRSSFSNLRSSSEADISARINIIKAREESRNIPRQFGLYLPPSLSPKVSSQTPQEPILWTTSLSLILTRLEGALRTFTKVRRNIERQKEGTIPGSSPPANPKLALPDFLHVPSRAPSWTDLAAAAAAQAQPQKPRKGKERNTGGPSRAPTPLALPKPWFLDIASPTWEDMRAIGKILHLHPLTLEDILQQDPREKLELFPKLGYYFIAFRAIATGSQRSLKGNVFHGDRDVEDVGEANIYMIVFTEGLCVFHFTDIAAHTNRVRSQILSMETALKISSDWLAHVLLDSIVDSFFPWLEEIEKEVFAIEDVVFSGITGVNPLEEESALPSETTLIATDDDTLSMPEKTEPSTLKLSEKNIALLEVRGTQTQFTRGRLPLRLLVRRWRRFFLRHWRTAQSVIEKQSAPSAMQLTLRRMARARRLVTSLSRLLGSKSEVVMQVQKRLLTSTRTRTTVGTHPSEDVEVAIYLGDVQDHILTLQNSLTHFERMLSQSHPTYLSQLRTGVALTKKHTDRALIYLTVVSIGCLTGQCFLGLFSMNIRVPRNARYDPDYPENVGPFNKFNVFGCIVAALSIIITSYMALVRRWWLRTKQRRNAQLL